ncbi:ABC transporter permease [Bacillaceae bacterium]
MTQDSRLEKEAMPAKGREALAKWRNAVREFLVRWHANADLRQRFFAIVKKEIADHFRSWRFLILYILITLTCFASLYAAMSGIREAVNENDRDAFVFLQLFSATDGSLPTFITFVSFIGPLIGIALGFDAINSEKNKGTLSRVLAQPIHRDYLINGKFLAALTVIAVMFFSLGFIVMGLGLLLIGIPPSVEEFLRMLFFLLVSIVYVAFWLNLAILFSIWFRQAATSALASIAVWLFFSVFYQMIVGVLTNAVAPVSSEQNVDELLANTKLEQALLRFSPSQLFSEATTTLLIPSVRTLGPVLMQQVEGAIPGSLPLGQSLLLVWPQLTGLVAATVLCFALSYVLFMRQEIRS